MARGKKAARSANRRADGAHQQIVELRQTLNQERAAWQQERDQLRNEVQQLRNKVRSDIDAAAADDITAAQHSFREELQAERDKWHERAEAVQQLIDNNEVRMPVETLHELADLLEVKPFQNVGGNRRVRRLTPRQAKRNHEMVKQLDQTSARKSFPA